jgi:murein DD-endopeptidase MepM/ murein hydrolase activator NlpD
LSGFSCSLWRIALVCLTFVLCTPIPSLSADSNNDCTTPEKGTSKCYSIIKAGKSGKKTKKPELNNPERLEEIVEKSILAIQSGDVGDAGSNLDLPVRGRVSSTVGIRPDPINGDIRMHNGIDISIAEGTPVRPVAPGRVAYSGMQPGYGNMVIIQHDDGMISIYAHHLRNLVKTGDRVNKESVLAYSGSTGHSTGPHLHFEAWQAGVNVTSAFLRSFAGRRFEASSHGALETTNLRKVIMSDGTILYIEVARKK